MTTVTFDAPRHRGVPLGAALAASSARLRAWVAKLPAARLQAREEAQRFADAARVRRLAQSLMADDPRLASDLFAAADRHEIG